MLHVKDLPDREILSKFVERYPQADSENVMRFLTLLQVATELTTSLNQYLAEYDLLQGRWWVLLLLMREPDLTASPSVLAEKAGVSRATMTGLLEGLFKKKLIRRVAVETDRRQINVCLTQQGQAKLDALMPGYYERVNALLSVLSDSEAQVMTDVLHLLHQQRYVFQP
jgi:DNA-binding MarR family transcriptional regulator